MSATNPYSYQFVSEFSKYYDKIADHVDIDIVFKIRMNNFIEPVKGNKDGLNKKVEQWKAKSNTEPMPITEIGETLDFCYGRGKYCAINDANY